MTTAQHDRGWHHVSAFTQDYEFGNDQTAYVGAMSAVEWEALRWSIGDAYQIESSPGVSWWHVPVLVEGGLAAVPPVLFEHGLAHPLCVDDDAPGFGVIVTQSIVGPPTVGSGAMTGNARAGRCPGSGPFRAEQFEPGDEMTWTGHELEVRNWTMLPLVLVHESGRRFDIGPCDVGQVDGFGGEVTIRAAGGYVATFGWEHVDDITTFVVIGSRDVYLNNAPPAEPMPPCEGEPMVQPDE
ncbi:MAG: hypothetical protein ACRDFR_04955 [Candidatus Limnocylindria bacterium]